MTVLKNTGQSKQKDYRDLRTGPNFGAPIYPRLQFLLWYSFRPAARVTRRRLNPLIGAPRPTGQGPQRLF